jgi:hypothetical protein
MALFIAPLLLTAQARAYLGGFENPDGYRPFFDDVAKYNAGAHGANAGGGVYTPITPNTGLWKKLQGPLHPATGTTGSFAYATGHQNFDRTNPGSSDQALVITTNADGWNAGPQEYSYQVDSFDLGGVNPLSTGGTLVKISFWSCSFIPGSTEGGGLGPNTLANTISFYDSGGNLGFAVGGIQPGTSTDFAAYNVGAWVQSSVAVGTNTYHQSVGFGRLHDDGRSRAVLLRLCRVRIVDAGHVWPPEIGPPCHFVRNVCRGVTCSINNLQFLSHCYRGNFDELA